MISAAAICLAAAAANCIISTAPMAKFGATNTLAPVSSRQRVEIEASRPDDDVHAGGHGGRAFSRPCRGR